jgi:hypothetical protein
MYYHLFFDRNLVGLGIAVPRSAWRFLHQFRPHAHPEIDAYLGHKSDWHSGEEGSLGYGGCADMRKNGEHLESIIALAADKLPCTLLTLAFLIDHCNGTRFMEGQPRSDFELTIGCGPRPAISGIVTASFKDVLVRLTRNDLNLVEADMREAWRTVAPRVSRKYVLDCRAIVTADRFMLGCFGNACDVAIYPESDPLFDCHNLDSSYQQVTLLVGLASLCERVRSKA